MAGARAYTGSVDRMLRGSCGETKRGWWLMPPTEILHFFFFSSRRRHTRCLSDWSSDVCSSDLARPVPAAGVAVQGELAYTQDVSPAQGLVHSPLGVGEDAEVPDLVGEPVGLLLTVGLGDRSEERRVGKEGKTGRGTHS